ncbi:hypothetical protein WME91_06020 [Sorangium sp. So ce269]
MYVVLGASGLEGFASRTRLLRPVVEPAEVGAILMANARSFIEGRSGASRGR